MGWTPNQVEKLRAMLGESKTMQECADALGRGITRNACIGKARRMGFVSLVPQTGKGPTKVRKPAPEPKPRRIVRTTSPIILTHDLPLLSKAAAYRAFEPTTARKSIFELEADDCRDLKDGTYCAAPCVPGRSYCSYHARLMYVPSKPMKLSGIAA